MVVGLMTFQRSLLLVVAILLGLVATVVTFMNSRKLKGDIFEKPFVYLSLGIFLATFSLIAVTFFQGVLSEIQVSLIHDISFILGLGLMLVVSMQITKFLTGLGNFEKNLSNKKG
ncbi:hypothetical protein KAS08_04635 [Candidatus Pacearchaeota archaeon]|nr:hypothetical protein [Candidatus Pacearchaeota archaeon]